MRTLHEMLEADKYRVKAPTLRFKDFCQYIYEPMMAAEHTNLSEDQQRALVEDISIRIQNRIDPTWPPNYEQRLLSDIQ